MPTGRGEGKEGREKERRGELSAEHPTKPGRWEQGTPTVHAGEKRESKGVVHGGGRAVRPDTAPQRRGRGGEESVRRAIRAEQGWRGRPHAIRGETGGGDGGEPRRRQGGPPRSRARRGRQGRGERATCYTRKRGRGRTPTRDTRGEEKREGEKGAHGLDSRRYTRRGETSGREEGNGGERRGASNPLTREEGRGWRGKGGEGRGRERKREGLARNSWAT